MTQQRSKLHIETPIDDVDEIPYDRSQMGPGCIVLEVEFSRDELARLRRALGPGPGMVRFVKRAALETADREAKAKSDDGLHAAD